MFDGRNRYLTDQVRIVRPHEHRMHTTFQPSQHHVKLPIFIARQWIRHRTANVNEYSARYSILDKEFYIPAKEQLSAQATNNRQGRGDLITGEQADEVLKILKDDAERSFSIKKIRNRRN